MKWLMFVTNRDLTGDREHEFRALADAKGLDSRRLTRKALQRYQQFQAVTDDNPYLRNTAAMRERQVALHETDWMTSAPVGMNRPRTIRYLVAFLAVLLLACLLAMVVPLYRSPRLRTRNIRRLLAFFAAIGIGFITLELTFIHKFTLFLGQPIYAVSVTLASICFFGGLGSLLTARVGDHDIPRQMVRAMWPLVIVTGVFVVALNPLLNALVALSPGLKILVAIGMLGIPSVFLGMMFPLGLRLAKNTSETIIPWMVGIDGMTSVVGGTVSYLVALFFGFNAALILGIGMYLLALGIVSGIGSDA